MKYLLDTDTLIDFIQDTDDSRSVSLQCSMQVMKSVSARLPLLNCIADCLKRTTLSGGSSWQHCLTGMSRAMGLGKQASIVRLHHQLVEPFRLLIR